MDFVIELSAEEEVKGVELHVEGVELSAEEEVES